jgi:protocatechuate 3,4-dioxygenase beta subunit
MEFRRLAVSATLDDEREALERLSARYVRLAASRSGKAARGERIIVGGRVLDDEGRAVPGVTIEVWQANSAGRYSHPDHDYDAPLDPDFSGHLVLRSDADGRYSYATVRPGRYPDPNQPGLMRPSHIHLVLSVPGLTRKLFTEMYFPADAPPGTERIFLPPERLAALPNPALSRRSTGRAYRFDLVLGDRANATPFATTGRHSWLGC